MGEVKKPLIQLNIGDSDVTIITDEHSVADIARWLIEEGIDSEIIMFLTGEHRSLL